MASGRAGAGQRDVEAGDHGEPDVVIDYAGFKHDFRVLFGFEVPGVDYAAAGRDRVVPITGTRDAPVGPATGGGSLSALRAAVTATAQRGDQSAGGLLRFATAAAIPRRPPGGARAPVPARLPGFPVAGVRADSLASARSASSWAGGRRRLVGARASFGLLAGFWRRASPARPRPGLGSGLAPSPLAFRRALRWCLRSGDGLMSSGSGWVLIFSLGRRAGGTRCGGSSPARPWSSLSAIGLSGP